MQPIKFIHFGDTHLGFRQYNLQERFLDFNRAFRWVLKAAVEQDVDFILHGGDMFDDNHLAPETMTAVYLSIQEFRENSMKQLGRFIPIIAIEGNHDLNRTTESRSWMKFLAELDLIILLNPTISDDQTSIDFIQYSKKTHTGGSYTVKDATIYGFPFHGSVTSQYFPLIKDAIPKSSQSMIILLMHFGLNKEVKNRFGIDVFESGLQDLRENIDYLALGHFHKMYIRPKDDEWIYNPGSLELTDIFDYLNDYERGVFFVEMHGKAPAQRAVTRWLCANGGNGFTSDLEPIPNRRILSYPIDIGLSRLSSFEKTEDYVLECINKTGLAHRESSSPSPSSDPNYPILSISLRGTVSYSSLEINLIHLRTQLYDIFNVLEVRIHMGSLESMLDGLNVAVDNQPSLPMIETQIFSQIIQQNEKWQALKEPLLNLIQDVKFHLLDNKYDPQDLKAQIAQWWHQNEHPLPIPLLNKLTRKEEIKQKKTSSSGENQQISKSTQKKSKNLNDFFEDLREEEKPEK